VAGRATLHEPAIRIAECPWPTGDQDWTLTISLFCHSTAMLVRGRQLGGTATVPIFKALHILSMIAMVTIVIGSEFLYAFAI
jgi:hypothetical protein